MTDSHAVTQHVQAGILQIMPTVGGLTPTQRAPTTFSTVRRTMRESSLAGSAPYFSQLCLAVCCRASAWAEVTLSAPSECVRAGCVSHFRHALTIPCHIYSLQHRLAAHAWLHPGRLRRCCKERLRCLAHRQQQVIMTCMPSVNSHHQAAANHYRNGTGLEVTTAISMQSEHCIAGGLHLQVLARLVRAMLCIVSAATGALQSPAI